MTNFTHDNYDAKFGAKKLYEIIENKFRSYTLF